MNHMFKVVRCSCFKIPEDFLAFKASVLNLDRRLYTRMIKKLKIQK